MAAKTLIGIRREDKNPWERRAPIIPIHARELSREYPLEFWMQPSPIRIFPDQDYAREGVKISEDLSPCPIVLAVKEIPVDFFQEGKIYVFFSHTIKGQPYNMPLLQRMIDRGCTLIDYERIVDKEGRRLVFFGRQAGQAGMIDTLWALGQRLQKEGIESPFSSLRKTIDYASLVEAKEAVQKVGLEIHRAGLDPSLVPFICGFAGYGHVSGGAQEIFDLMPFEEVTPGDAASFFRGKRGLSNKVYKLVFKEKDMVEPKKKGRGFNLQDYYDNPDHYKPVLDKFIPDLTVFINAIFWSPKYPRFITKDFLKKLYGGPKLPRLRVIGDISCDISGAVECTVRSTNPSSPVFLYDVQGEQAVERFSGKGPLVMAVDNLPAEISLESSIFFSKTLKPFLPALASADFSQGLAQCNLPAPLKKAVILFRGKLTPEYEYMKNFINLSERSHS